MGETEISWTHRPGTVGRTWNPGEGCSLVSEGCRNCYAMRIAARFAGDGWSQGLVNIKTRKWNGVVRLRPHKLADPLRWRKPSTVFVNSMTDLFHDGYTNEEIAAVFGVMAAAPQHTFQVLTKRAKRMREWFAWLENEGGEFGPPHAEICGIQAVNHCVDLDSAGLPHHWPLPNVWLGVSVENQEAANERVPELLATPAAVRFLSCEPLIGPVAISGLGAGRIEWLIAGCESGDGARECDVGWLRSLRDQCASSGVPFFLKQARQTMEVAAGAFGCRGARGGVLAITGGPGAKKKGRAIFELPYLDGVQHAAFPAVP